MSKAPKTASATGSPGSTGHTHTEAVTTGLLAKGTISRPTLGFRWIQSGASAGSRVLQQMWIDDDIGEEWRDVPVEIVSEDGP